MAARLWIVTLIVWLMAGPTVVRAGERPRGAAPVMAVYLDNQDRAMVSALSGARTLVVELFRRAGITIVWVDAAGGYTGRVFTMTVRPWSLKPRPWAGGAEVLGTATPGEQQARGTSARVFSDRVLAFADAYGVPLPTVLGGVVAHELGHLLLPLNAHSERGIMQAVWSARAFPPRAAGVPGFLPEQAQLLRQRLAAFDAAATDN